MVKPVAESSMPWTEQPPRLDVCVVGTGRVGSVLGAALRRSGHKVIACTAVSEISRLRADSLLPGVPVLSIDNAVAQCDLVLLTIPDDALADVVAGLATTKAISPGTFVMHTSGRYGIDILEPLTEIGCLPLAVHPVMTFTGTSIDIDRLSDCPFGVTSPEVLRPAAQALVVEMGGEPIWVPQEMRLLYHAALSFGANNIMTLVNETVGLLTQAQIEHPEQLISQLFGASLDNALRLGDSALTGPISRCDIGTIRAHLAMLKEKSPRTVASYVALGQLTVARCLDAGILRTQQAGQILEVLSE